MWFFRRRDPIQHWGLLSFHRCSFRFLVKCVKHWCCSKTLSAGGLILFKQLAFWDTFCTLYNQCTRQMSEYYCGVDLLWPQMYDSQQRTPALPDALISALQMFYRVACSPSDSFAWWHLAVCFLSAGHHAICERRGRQTTQRTAGHLKSLTAKAWKGVRLER